MPPRGRADMTPQDRRLARQRLEQLAARLRQAALIARNGDNTAAGETRALALEQEAAAVVWALGHVSES